MGCRNTGSDPSLALTLGGECERVALAAMVVCLEMSRLGWKCGEVEETAMLLRAAAGHMKEKEWEAWVVGNVGKKA